jgi:hypothetical protein
METSPEDSAGYVTKTFNLAAGSNKMDRVAMFVPSYVGVSASQLHETVDSAWSSGNN